MQTRLLQIFEILWLVVAAISIVELVFAVSAGHWTRAATFGIFAILGVFMFFFRRNMRKKQQNNKG